MNRAIDLIEQIESCGGVLAVKDGDRIAYELPEEMAGFVDQLREQKSEIMEVLRQRETIPRMPPGVRLISWSLKQPPVAPICPAPAGYDHQITGECRQDVVSTTHGTWGALKKLYR